MSRRASQPAAFHLGDRRPRDGEGEIIAAAEAAC